MGISESQLDTWSHQGSVTQSSNTYNTIKNVLESANTPYAGKDYRVFLQGSYGSDTNIYAESDVDIVIQLNDCFQHDLGLLTENQRIAFQSAFSDAAYTLAQFKSDVLTILKDEYGASVDPGEKAIAIGASGSRRKADVIVGIQYRRYHKFNGTCDQVYDEGICFYSSTGQRIINYPKQHSTNLTVKHQATKKWLKPMVRVLKNLRGKLIDKKMIADGVAPSYYLEGLLYNVPNDKFTNSYVECFINCINWIQQADKTEFLCANEQYYLLREGSPVTWRTSKCEEFLTAVVGLWNQW